eukprot:663653-Pyramimonas_sp.AAC.1
MPHPDQGDRLEVSHGGHLIPIPPKPPCRPQGGRIGTSFVLAEHAPVSCASAAGTAERSPNMRHCRRPKSGQASPVVLAPLITFDIE